MLNMRKWTCRLKSEPSETVQRRVRGGLESQNDHKVRESNTRKSERLNIMSSSRCLLKSVIGVSNIRLSSPAESNSPRHVQQR